jgi:MYXO-CTERM domain-containing protein
MSRYYADDTQGVFWFVHITDLHIDTGDNTVEDRLRFALGEVVDVVAPVAVFASGDLVDGTVLGIPTSGQDPAEWDIYASILADAQMTPSFYFDMPGNHDGYGDQGLNNFIESSMQGQASGALFADATHTTPLGDYYFVAMNSAGTYATPFTFGDPQFTNVAELEAGLAANAAAQLVFVFGHHHLVEHGHTDAQMALGIGGSDDPPGNVAEVMPLLENVGAFYLHGHVHQYKESLQGGVVTVQLSNLSGTPEVDRSSLDAWDETKYQSNIGVGIVDHNAFVYRVTDTTNPWPFVAITAPVDVNLQGGGIPAGSSAGVSWDGDFLAYGAQANPYAYDVCLDRTDNPVRAVVLSKDPVSTVSVALDSSVLGLMAPAADPPGVYTAKMDTTGLEPGLHAITVTAVAGTVARSDSIQVNFVAGPCDTLPDAGVDASDAAPDVQEDVAPDAKPEATVPDVTTDAASDAGDADEGGLEASASAAASEDDGGCSCRVGSGRASDGAGLLAALIGLLALHCRRRTLRAGTSAATFG